MKRHLPYLSYIRKIQWWKTIIFMELSNQIMWFFHASTMWYFGILETGVFNYIVLQTATKILWFYILRKVLMEYYLNIFFLNPDPRFFLRPCTWYWKISMVFFQYLVVSKLSIKLGCCHSILGLETNHKRLKYTFQKCIVCHILKQHGAVILKKCEDKYSTKENFGKKLWISANTWRNIKLLYWRSIK